LYDQNKGLILKEMNNSPSGHCSEISNGPRYVEFHPEYDVMYCVNELSSTVSVDVTYV